MSPCTEDAEMIKRWFDIIFSLAMLVVALPLFVLVSIVIRLFDRGPIFYRARRQGQNAHSFILYKFRSMRIGSDIGSGITSTNDDRVSLIGGVLRRSKLDELPQFWNVLKGDMSVVGPRPEDGDIVRRCFTSLQRRTLSVRPGIASPGSIFNFTHGHHYLEDADPSGSYERQLLPIKLGLELVYVDDRNLAYDLKILGRTIKAIVATLSGKRDFSLPPEYAIAKRRGYFDD